LLERLSLAARPWGLIHATPLPRQGLFLYARKEAALSSQIEGAQSTLSDFLRFETEAHTGQPVDNIREVSNNDAVMYDLDRLGNAADVVATDLQDA